MPETHEPRFGCRWGLLQEADVTPENAPIMCEDDDGPYVLHEHFEQLQQQFAAMTQERDEAMHHAVWMSNDVAAIGERLDAAQARIATLEAALTAIKSTAKTDIDKVKCIQRLNVIEHHAQQALAPGSETQD